MTELKDAFGNSIKVGDKVRVTARRGGSYRYADRQITRTVAAIAGSKVVMPDSEMRLREFDPNDLTRVGDDGELMIHW